MTEVIKKAYLEVSYACLEDWLRFNDNDIKIIAVGEATNNKFYVVVEGDVLPDECRQDLPRPLPQIKPIYMTDEKKKIRDWQLKSIEFYG